MRRPYMSPWRRREVERAFHEGFLTGQECYEHGFGGEGDCCIEYAEEVEGPLNRLLRRLKDRLQGRRTTA